MLLMNALQSSQTEKITIKVIYFSLLNNLIEKPKLNESQFFPRTHTVRVERIFSNQRDKQNNNEFANIINFIY